MYTLPMHSSTTAYKFNGSKEETEGYSDMQQMSLHQIYIKMDIPKYLTYIAFEK